MEKVKLRILTYNTHLMAGSNVEVGAWYKNKLPVGFHDRERQNFIIKKIRESGAHIVALQEVWAATQMEEFQKQLADPYRFYARGDREATELEALAILITRRFFPEGVGGSGLVLLSKFPLADVRFERFPNPADEEERAASKGVLTATVEVGGKLLHIGMTHAWTDAGGEECKNIQQLIQQTAMIPTAALLMGDFNIHRTSKKFDRLDQLMKENGARDSWSDKHGKDHDQDSATDDETHNNLAQFFSPMRDTGKPDCIDYVYTKNSPALEIKVTEAKVLRDWKYETQQGPRWYWVHDGTVSGSPAATPFGPKQERLCVVTRLTDGRLFAAVCDGTTNRWTHSVIRWGEKVAFSHGAPGLIWWMGALHLFYQYNQEVYKMESTDGLKWGEWKLQGFRSSGGVCAVVCEGTPQVFVRDAQSDISNQVRNYQFAGQWRGPYDLGVETEHNISAAVLGQSMIVVTKDPTGRPDGQKTWSSGIMNSRLERPGKDWVRNQQIAGHAETRGSPGVMAYKDNYFVFYRDPKGDAIFSRFSGDNWSTEHRDIWVDTDGLVTPVVWGDKVLLFFPFPVDEELKRVPGKLIHPEGAVLYPMRALAHCRWPASVVLDASDHYPYMVDLELTTKS